MTIRAAVLTVLTALAAAALAVGHPVAAIAAADGGSAVPACHGAHPVTVVVDPHDSGRGPSAVCDPDGGGRTAAQLFDRNGFPLTDVAGQPGFVCRVAGRPADDPCAGGLDPNAYWALWWTDGHGGWTYSTLGVDSLEIPDGGAVAFVWDDVPGNRSPSVPATAAPRSGAASATSSRPQPTEQASGGLPAWAAPVAVGVALAAVATAVLSRRRREARR